jgi:hypothetical protein
MKLSTILVTSGYGGNSRQPFVEINNDKLKSPLQISPGEARDLAANLLQAAEAADQDAFIFEFHSSLVDGSADEKKKVGGMALVAFRKFRDEYGQNK